MAFCRYGVVSVTLIALLVFAKPTDCQRRSRSRYPTEWVVRQAGNSFFKEKAGVDESGAFNPYMRFRSDGHDNPPNTIASSRSIIDLTKKQAAIKVSVNNKRYCFMIDYPKIPTKQSLEQRRNKIVNLTKAHKMVVDGTSPMRLETFKAMYEQGNLKSKIFEHCEKDYVFKIKDVPPPVTGMMPPTPPSGAEVKVSGLLASTGIESMLIHIHGIPSVPSVP